MQTPLKQRLKISVLLDVLIFVYFSLLVYIIFAGGFYLKLSGFQLTATSIPKPAITLALLITLKVVFADYRNELEKNKILLYGTLVFMFLAGEIVARVHNHYFVEEDLLKASERFVKKIQRNPVNLSLFDIIKIHPNIRITYDLIPHVKGKFLNTDLSVNSIGIRDDRDYPKKKEEKEIRIIGLGDSEMFGWRVEFSDTYGEQIESRLRKRLNEGEKLHFLNFGLLGYNTTMQVETLLTKGIELEPDLVLISFVVNDLNLPNFIIKKESSFSFQKSFLIYYALKKLNSIVNYNLNLFNLTEAPFSSNDLRVIPDEYKFMIGKRAYEREMKKLKSKCDELNIPLILFIEDMDAATNPLNKFARATAGELNIPVVGWSQEAKLRVKQLGENLNYFRISENDYHANKRGHFLKAQVLAPVIESALKGTTQGSVGNSLESTGLGAVLPHLKVE